MKPVGKSPRRRYIALGALALLAGQEARGEWPFFDRSFWLASLDWEQRNVTLTDERQHEEEFRTNVEIRQSGFWSDPRIVKFNYTINPSFVKRLDELEPELGIATSSNSRSDLLSYAISINILQGAMAPVEASLHSSQSDGEFRATLSGTSESSSRQNTANLLWKLAPFPLQFMISERDLFSRSDSVFTRSPVKRDELNRMFRIRGESSKLSMTMEHETIENRLSGFTSGRDLATLGHRFSWGRASSLKSQFNFRRRERQAATSSQQTTSTSFSQDFKIRHTDSVKSSLDYRYQEDSGIQDTQRLDGAFTIEHSLYQNLNSALFIFGNGTRAQSTDTNYKGAGMSFGYGKGFFGTRVGLNTSYRRSGFERVSRQGFVEVIDEPVEIAPDGRAVLPDRFIEPDSIVITDTAGGMVFLEGFDYEILRFGNGVFIVAVIPGGNIEFGQPVLASYIAALQPSGKFSETEGRYSFSVRRGAFSLHHSAISTGADLEEGFISEELQDRRQSSTNAGYSWTIRRGSFRLDAVSDRWQDRGLKITSKSLNAVVSIAITSSANMAFSLSQQEARTTSVGLGEGEPDLNELDTVFSNARLGLDWRATPSLTIRSSILAWQRDHDYPQDPTRSFEEDIIGAQVNFDYQFRRFSASLALFYNDWQIIGNRAGSDYFRSDDGFKLRIMRQF